MGSTCSNKKTSRQLTQIDNRNDLVIQLIPIQQSQQDIQLDLSEIQEIRDKKQTKIDIAHDSLDLMKKRYSSKDASQLQKMIDQEIQKNQSQRIDKLTIDMKEHGGQQSQRERIISQFQRDISFTINENQIDEDSACYQIYTNPKCKQKKEMNRNFIQLINQNDTILDKTIRVLLYKIITDYHFQIENKIEFENILIRSQESFLQNLQITDRFINNYGVFHILKESLKRNNIEIVLQNDFALKQDINLSYNKLQMQLKDLPFTLSLLNQKLIQLIFIQSSITYQKLQNNKIILYSFLESIRKMLQHIIQINIIYSQILFLSLSLQNDEITLLVFIPQMNFEENKQFINLIQTEMNGFLGLKTCGLIQMIKYLGAELIDLDPWINREFKEETNADSLSIQFGWKLFGLNAIQCQDFHSGFISYNYSQEYNRQIRIYTLNEINKLTSEQLESQEIKVYGEKRYFKLMFQISYKTEDCNFKDGKVLLNSLQNSELIGIMVYDEERARKVI